MARNHRTALYLNDPVKIFGGVLSWKQAGCLVADLALFYALFELTKRLPYGQSTAGQLHVLLVVGVPALLGYLTFSLLGKGAVEPYPRQFGGYLLRRLAAMLTRLGQMATIGMRTPPSPRREMAARGTRGGNGRLSKAMALRHRRRPSEPEGAS